MRKLSLGVLLLVLAAFLGGFFWWQWANGAIAPKLKAPAEGEARLWRQSSKLKAKEKVFVVKKGEGISSIAERLQQEKLIKSSLVFRILVAKEGLIKKIQAGDFRLNPGMTPLEIGQELTHGTLDVWVTIPEGWRKEEIAEAISSQFAVYSSQFLEAAKDNEGYLFPDTYLVSKEATAGAIIKIFLKNFEKKFDEEHRQKAEEQGLTINEVLTLASIVEREVKHEEDRPIVAGILLKRWENNWPLQADATVQYAVATLHSLLSTLYSQVDWWPRNLIKEDLKIDSPYNTYLYKGLPPGPICNPGLASIKAVIDPKKTDYWYYLSDSQGKMYYARTDEEHAENIKRFLLK